MKISERTYNKNEVITFSKTTGKFGGLSNMAPGYSLFVNETNIANTEILYQACRFPLSCHSGRDNFCDQPYGRQRNQPQVSSIYQTGLGNSKI